MRRADCLLQRPHSIPAVLLTGMLLLCILFTTACSSIPTSKPETPEFRLVDVTPTNLSLTNTRLIFTLEVTNTNSFDLPLRQLDFIASFDGEKIADGVATDAVTIPAGDKANLDIEVAVGLSKLFSKMVTLLNSDSALPEYGLKGSVKLANWPVRIPFEVTGEAG